MPLQIPFKALIRMGLNQELTIVVGLHSLIGLFIRLAFFFVYAPTLISMYFPYALIIILSLTELHINAQLFKKTLSTVFWYSSVTVYYNN